MIGSIRRFSKSKLGSFTLVFFVLVVGASFALMDFSNVSSGNLTGQSNSTLVTVGSRDVTDQDMSRAMERRLQQARQQDPNATYADLAGDFAPILASLVDEFALSAFADSHDFRLSPRLIGAEIAQIPGARGPDGRFSEQAYQAFLSQQRISDGEVRQLVRTMLLQRLLLSPVGSAARVPVGVATPYASMLLEARQGQVAFVPVTAFRAGLAPTDAQLQQFYVQNRSRYMVPEQRVLRIARIGAGQVGDVAVSDAEIAAHYKANQASYAARELRVLSQAIAQNQQTAAAIAAKAKGGATLAQAVAGTDAADSTFEAQTRQQFSGVAGEAVAAAVFGAASGDVVGPVRSELGWHVVKVESVQTEGGKTLAEARDEIAATLTANKRKAAIEELANQVQDAIDGGANFTEAAAAAKLTVSETPLITAAGTAPGDAGFKLPQELAPALRSGFELGADDEPLIETMPDDAGYMLVAPARIVPTAPAPLASIQDRVRTDWVNRQAAERARAVATAVAAKVARNVPLEQAMAESKASLPPVQKVASRRLELAQMGDQVPPPVRMLFTLGEGKSRMVADAQGRGYFVVKVEKIIPGNAASQPALISTVQRDFQQPLAQEYGEQFIAALREAVGVERNESAIAASKLRMTSN